MAHRYWHPREVIPDVGAPPAVPQVAPTPQVAPGGPQQPQEDPLAAYSPDWRQKLAAPVQEAPAGPAAQPVAQEDPLALYTPDWRERVEALPPPAEAMSGQPAPWPGDRVVPLDAAQLGLTEIPAPPPPPSRELPPPDMLARPDVTAAVPVPDRQYAAPGPFERGLRSAVGSYQTALGEGLEQVGAATGAAGLREHGERISGEAQQRLERLGPSPSVIEGAKEAFGSGDLRKIVEWGQYALGQGLGTMAGPMAAAAGGAALAGPGGAVTGARAGAFSVSYPLMLGEIRSNLEQVEDIDQASIDKVAPLVALPAAALDAIVPGKIGSGLFARTAAGMAQRIATGLVREGLEEGLTEMGQTFIGQATRAGLSEEQALLTWGNVAELVEAGAAGALTGGVVGGAGGALQGRLAAAPPAEEDLPPPPPMPEAEIPPPPAPTTPEEAAPAPPAAPAPEADPLAGYTENWRTKLADVIAPERAEERRQVQRELETDAQTGIGNRRAWERAKETAEADPGTAVVVFDLNNLKAANDLVGHEFGDEMIQRAATTIQEETPRAFRVGGDEFVALVPAEQAEAVRQAVEEQFGTEQAGDFTVSVTGRAGQTFTEADAALQAVKRGRGAGEAARPMGPEAQQLADVSPEEAAGFWANPAELDIEPERFQYKEMVDPKTGETGALQGVRKWDPERAGIIVTWRDPADGRLKVVNGHQRVNLARGLGVEQLRAFEIDARDAQQARFKGALINIGEGSGTAVDAAKVFRDSGMTPAMMEEQGVPLTQGVVRDGLALANLHEGLFDLAARGKVPLQRMATIGRSGLSPDQQMALWELVQKQPKSERLTNAEIEELARFVGAAPTEQVSQETLFGTETFDESLALEKARLSAWAKEQLKKQARLFRFVSRGGRAEQIERAGAGQIDVERAGQIGTEAEQVAEVYERLSASTGPVSEALNRAVTEIRAGANENEVRQGLLANIRDAVQELLVRPGVASEAGPEVLGRGEEGPLDRGALPEGETGPAAEGVVRERPPVPPEPGAGPPSAPPEPGTGPPTVEMPATALPMRATRIVDKEVKKRWPEAQEFDAYIVEELMRSVSPILGSMTPEQFDTLMNSAIGAWQDYMTGRSLRGQLFRGPLERMQEEGTVPRLPPGETDPSGSVREAPGFYRNTRLLSDGSSADVVPMGDGATVLRNHRGRTEMLGRIEGDEVLVYSPRERTLVPLTEAEGRRDIGELSDLMREIAESRPHFPWGAQVHERETDLFGEPVEPEERQGELLERRGPEGMTEALDNARAVVSTLEGAVQRGAATPTDVRRYNEARSLIRGAEGRGLDEAEVQARRVEGEPEPDDTRDLFEGLSTPEAFREQVAITWGSPEALQQATAELAEDAGDLLQVSIPGVRSSAERIEAVKAGREAAHAWVPATGHVVKGESEQHIQEDVYRLLRSFRHPGQEYFHLMVLVPTEGGQQVAHHRMVTAGAVDTALVSVAEVAEAAAIAARLGGTLVAAHNHPSGDPSPSVDDRALNTQVARVAAMNGAEFGGHYVIDSETAIIIDRDGNDTPVSVPATEEARAADWNQPGMRRIRGPEDAFRYLSALPHDEGRLDVLLLNTSHEVVAYEVRPVSDLDTMSEWLPELRREAAAPVVVLGAQGKAAWEEAQRAATRAQSNVFDIFDPSAPNPTAASARQSGFYKPQATELLTPVFEREPEYETPGEGEQLELDVNRPRRIVSLKKDEGAEVRARLGLEKLGSAERESFQDAWDRARADNLKETITLIATEAIESRRPLRSEEHAAAVQRMIELERELTQSRETLAEATAQANDEVARREAIRSNDILEELDVLTQATDRAGTEAGRALAIRKLRADAETMTLAQVLQQARTIKGSALTQEEVGRLEAAFAEVEKLQKANAELRKQNERLAAEMQLDLAEAVAQTTTRRARRSRKKLEGLYEERNDLRNQLAALGVRLNDVTGLGPEALYLIGRLAKNRIETLVAEGQEKVTLERIVNDVLADLNNPAITARDVHEALNTQDPKRQKRQRTEAEKQVAELQTQSRLLNQIEDAENGIFAPGATRGERSAEVRNLQRRLTALRNAAYRSGQDARALERAVRKINELQDFIENQHRPLRQPKLEVTPELQNLRDQVQGLRRELRTEDTLTDLQEQLRTGNFKVPPRREPRYTSPELERNQVAVRRARRHVRNEMEKLAPLTGRKAVRETATFLRSVKATADMSGTLRQAFWLAVRRPVRAAGNFEKAVRAFFSEYTADQIETALREHPNQLIRDKAGLHLSEIGGAVNNREEYFSSQLAEKVPVLGVVVRASERHMATMLNLMRVSAFDQFVEQNPNATLDELKAWADWVNVASGRGDMGRLSAIGTELSTVVFAPRFAVSRFQTPTRLLTHWKEPRVRNEIAKDYAAVVSLVLSVLGLAAMAGLSVGLDPREADFGKIRWGDTRIDLWAGVLQPVRLLARIALGITDRAGLTGEHLSASERELDPLEALGRFAAFKLSPIVTVPVEFYRGRTAVGEEATPSETAVRAVLPIVFESVHEAYRAGGAGPAVATGLLEFLGAGAQTYADSETQVRRDIRRALEEGRADEAQQRADAWNALNPDDPIVSVRSRDGETTTHFTERSAPTPSGRTRRRRSRRSRDRR